MTVAGPVTPTITSDRTCSVEMGRATTTSEGLSGRTGGRAWHARFRATGTGFQHVSIGNPQMRDQAGADLEELDLAKIGPGIENNVLFSEPDQRLVLSGSGSRVARFRTGAWVKLFLREPELPGAAVAAFLAGAPARSRSNSTAANSR